MPYFAKIQPTTLATQFIVSEVISADQDFINSGAVGSPSTWIQTSYNTYGNVHYAPSPPAEPMTPDGGVAYRANYAGIGYVYDTSYTVNDVQGVFYAPQPYPSWILNTSTFLWEAPVPYPTDGNNYYWDEATLSWVLIPNPPAP
jgi:hypothetical protein